MIVDLMRNDLQRTCRPGTVEVTGLLEVEQHPGLVHLVSTVRGRLTDGATWPQMLAATMPPGSVSGAPKSSALRAIVDLEPVGPRPLLRCRRLGGRRRRDRLPGGRHSHLLVGASGRRFARRAGRPTRAAHLVRHRRRDHLGQRPGRRVGRDRAQGGEAGRPGVRRPTQPTSRSRRGSDEWSTRRRRWSGSTVGVSTRTQARVSALDHGLTVGDGVFETCKVVDGQAVRADPAPAPAGPFGVGARAARAGRELIRAGCQAAAGRRRRLGAGPAADHADRGSRAARLGPRHLGAHPRGGGLAVPPPGRTGSPR